MATREEEKEYKRNYMRTFMQKKRREQAGLAREAAKLEKAQERQIALAEKQAKELALVEKERLKKEAGLVAVKNIFSTELDKKRMLDDGTDLAGLINTAIRSVEPEKIDVEEYFSFLELNRYEGSLYKNIEITPTMAKNIRNHLMSMKHGTFSTVPLICKGGANCPIVTQCWFARRNNDGVIDHSISQYPLLQPCPVETAIIELKIKQYIHEHLSSDMNVTASVMNLISRLAELDIYEIRADMLLSNGDVRGEGQDLLMKTIDAINQKTGEAFFTFKEHPALAIKDKIATQRSKFMTQLLSTPEAKLAMAAKLKSAETTPSDSVNVLTKIATTLKRNAMVNDSFIDMDKED
jgi:hypothetical protein